MLFTPLKSVAGQSAGGESGRQSNASATAIVPGQPEKPGHTEKKGSPQGLEAEEAKEEEAGGAVTVLALQMVLVPPEDAPLVIIESVVRGLIARRRYRLMKVNNDIGSFLLRFPLTFLLLFSGDD